MFVLGLLGLQFVLQLWNAHVELLSEGRLDNPEFAEPFEEHFRLTFVNFVLSMSVIALVGVDEVEIVVWVEGGAVIEG